MHWQMSLSEVQKVTESFVESGSGRKFWDPSPAILSIKQFGDSIQEMILVLSQNGHILYPFFPNIPKKQYN